MVTFLLFSKRQRGVTLVELIVFIVIVSVAIVGILKVLEVTTRNSVNPVITKQALAIAESLLVEIAQQPFTFCDPNDTNTSIASSTTDCSTGFSQDNGGGTLGPIPSSESRYNINNLFDNVADYNGFVMPGNGCASICNLASTTPVDSNLTGYQASVVVKRAGVAPLPLDAMLQIDVTVTGPGNVSVLMTGYRIRFAPNG